MAAVQILIFSGFCLFLGCAHPSFRNRHGLKIVGGVVTDISEVPYQAALFTGGSDADLNCGGAIISENFIMTAAHCCCDIFGFSFRIGSNYYDSNGVIVEVKNKYIHPNYSKTFDKGTPDYDICVVETNTEIKYSKNIQPIPVADKVPQPDTPAKVAGWGITVENSHYASEKLISVVVPICNQTYCQHAYRWAHLERFICAGVEGKDSCSGDSGGALVANGKAVGVVSFGRGCAEKGYPGVYTSLAHPEIRSFIKKITNV